MDVSGVDIWESFLDTLNDLGLTASFDDAGDRRWDARGEIETVPVAIEIKPVPTAADVQKLDRRKPNGVYRILLARRVSHTMRDALARKGIGYYDARGHVRLWHRPLLVDAAVASRTPADETSTGPMRVQSPSMFDVALAVLDGSTAAGVRSAAERVGRAPGTVSKQLALLRAAHLADDRNEPAVPDLFEAVLDVWHPRRVALAALPPSAGAASDRLDVHFDDPARPGWVLSDARAAAAWGAPVVISSDAPPDFYVPTSQSVRNARTLLGAAEFGSHACTVAVAPATYVCRRRFDRSGETNEPYFAPSPTVTALDLAHDPARGRETLESWSRHLPLGVRRVW